MFSVRQDALLYSLNSIGQVVVLPAADDRRVWDQVERGFGAEICARADLALRTASPALTASGYKKCLAGTDGGYERGYTARRELIKALALGLCVRGDGRYAEKLADLIYDVCGERDWNLTGPADYPSAPGARLDVHACETAALLATASALCEAQLNRLSPRVCQTVWRAAQEYVLEPFADAGRGDCFDVPAGEMARACAAVTVTLLLVERDERRRWLCLRRAAKLIEGYLQALPADGSVPGGLEAQLDVAASVGDLFAVLNAATGGEVELRDDKLFLGMARVFVSAYIGGGWFLNPGGESMRPALSPDRLFRLGEGARDAELCSLAAYLRRCGAAVQPPFSARTESLYAQAMNLLFRNALVRETAREPLYETTRLYGMGLLSGRMDAFYAALTGGDNLSPDAHLDAGDVALFYQGRPVLVDAGARREAKWHSVPVISGFEQRTGLPGGTDAELQRNAGCLILSMNIARAYPKQAGLQSWQRTLMFAPFEGGVRLMDVFDFDHAQGVAIFRFITPSAPKLEADGALLGPLRMTWDAGRLTARVQMLPLETPEQRLLWSEGLYQIELQMTERAAGGNFSFAFRPIE